MFPEEIETEEIEICEFELINSIVTVNIHDFTTIYQRYFNRLVGDNPETKELLDDIFKTAESWVEPLLAVSSVMKNITMNPYTSNDLSHYHSLMDRCTDVIDDGVYRIRCESEMLSDSDERVQRRYKRLIRLAYEIRSLAAKAFAEFNRTHPDRRILPSRTLVPSRVCY